MPATEENPYNPKCAGSTHAPHLVKHVCRDGRHCHNVRSLPTTRLGTTEYATGRPAARRGRMRHAQGLWWVGGGREATTSAHAIRRARGVTQGVRGFLDGLQPWLPRSATISVRC
eukprot:3675107-Prymnesium_polylepis.2